MKAPPFQNRSSGRLTTGQVLDLLRKRGLEATPTQLDNDTRDGFLPKRAEPDVVDTGRGRSGRWEPWMVRRAERLYRYRGIRDPNDDSALSGDVLRVLLFLQDGWGWSGRIREAALRGLDKSIAATLKPVAIYTKRYRDRTDIATAMMMHDVRSTPGEKYSIGMLATGEPLDDVTLRPLYDVAKKMGLLDGLTPLNTAFAQFTGMKPNDAGAFLAEAFFTMGLGSYFGSKDCISGYASLFRSAMENLDDAATKEAVPEFRRFIRQVRSAIHREYVREKQRGRATNPLTAFGHPKSEVDKLLRESRNVRRITAAQMLALFFAVSAVSDQLVKSFLASLDGLIVMFQSLLLPNNKTT